MEQKRKMKYIVLTILIATHNLVYSAPAPRPQDDDDGGGGGAAAAKPAGGGNNLPLSWLMNSMPRSGIVGFGDNMGGAFANFGNGQGSAFNAILSGIFNAIGTLISGILGSGAISTSFLNYNNLPPPAPPVTGPPGGAAATPAPEE